MMMMFNTRERRMGMLSMFEVSPPLRMNEENTFLGRRRRSEVFC